MSHRGIKARKRPVSAHRGNCAVCGARVRLRVDGTTYWHHPPIWYPPGACRGSLKPPAVLGVPRPKEDT